MPYFNGQEVLLPSVLITVNNVPQASGATTPTTGLLFLGPANDGAPNVISTITSLDAAIALYNSGDLVQAIANAFTASTSAPVVNSLQAIQVNPLTAATSSIPGSGSNPAMALTTTHVGNPANTAQWQLNPGTVLGYQFQQQMLATQAGGGSYAPASTDNLGINALSLWYTGTGTDPTVTVTDSVFTVTATTSDVGGTMDLSTSLTLTQLAQQVNALTGWNALVTAANAQQTTAAFFDNVAASAVSTSATSPTPVAAHGFALAAFLQANPVYFTGTRPANCGAFATSSTWTVASGATSPAATTDNWQSAYTTAQSAIGVGVITPISSSIAMWDMNDAHCHLMATLNAGRIGYLGDQLGALSATEQTDAATLDSDRSSLVWPGLQGVDVNGNPTTFAPYLSSAPQLASMRSAMPLTQALTGQVVSATGLEQPCTSTLAGPLAAAGVIAIYSDATTEGAPTISWDRSTWQASAPVNKIENTMMVVVDVLTNDFNAVMKPYLGVTGSDAVVGAASADLYQRAMYWHQQGILVVEPTTSDFPLSISNGVLTGTAAMTLGEPTNYIVITLALQNGSFSAT